MERQRGLGIQREGIGRRDIGVIRVLSPAVRGATLAMQPALRDPWLRLPLSTAASTRATPCVIFYEGRKEPRQEDAAVPACSGGLTSQESSCRLAQKDRDRNETHILGREAPKPVRKR